MRAVFDSRAESIIGCMSCFTGCQNDFVKADFLINEKGIFHTLLR
ncbi:MAG: hypothetical protein V3S22_00940 [Candidatus Neomarinimicrobiota bacterium]